jgi:hypothetical protein
MTSSVVSKSFQTHAPLNLQDRLSQFLSGKIDLAGEDLIEELKKEPALNRLYCLSAGVGEGYSIEEHTRMVLDSFFKEFAPKAEVQDLLVKCNLTTHQFAFFLALHDIGKGLAVQEIPVNCKTRKELEHKYTIEKMETFCNQWGLQDQLPLFKGLLHDDAIGDYLKINGPWYSDANNAAKPLSAAASETGLDRDLFFKIKVLFHKIDAGSYPFLRYGLLSCSSTKSLEVGNQFFWEILDYTPYNRAKVKQLFIAVMNNKPVQELEGLDVTVKKSSADYTFAEIIQLKAAVKEAKETQSHHYYSLKERLIQIEERHLPFRSYRQIKMGNDEVKGVSSEKALSFPPIFNFILPISNSLLPPDSVNVKKIKEELQAVLAEETLESKFQFLSKLTFVHGSNSAALVLMHLRKRYQLECSGDLISQGIAPMSGGHDIGVSSFGINMKRISVETVRDLERAHHYATSYPFNPKELDYLKNPLSDLIGMFSFDDRMRRVRLNAIFKWQLDCAEEFNQRLGKGTLANRFFTTAIERELEKPDCHGKRKEDLSLVIEALQGKQPWPFFSLPPSSGLSALYNRDQFSEILESRCRDPFAPHVQKDNWPRTAIGLLQLQQWDRAAFEKEILTYRDQWHQSLEKVRTETERNMALREILAIVSFDCTEEEERLLINMFLKKDCSTEQASEKLLTLLDIIQEKTRYPTSQSYRLGGKDYLFSPQVVNSMNNYLKALQQKRHLQIQGNSEGALAKLESERNGTKKLVENALLHMERNYNNLLLALDGHATVSIPDDPKLRDLIIQPFPIIFSSTSIKPSPNLAGAGNEYNLLEPVHLGKGGCDILITNTEESKAKIIELLTDTLREEIEIHVFEELKVDDFPLIHSSHQIDQSGLLQLRALSGEIP